MGYALQIPNSQTNLRAGDKFWAACPLCERHTYFFFLECVLYPAGFLIQKLIIKFTAHLKKPRAPEPGTAHSFSYKRRNQLGFYLPGGVSASPKPETVWKGWVWSQQGQKSPHRAFGKCRARVSTLSSPDRGEPGLPFPGILLCVRCSAFGHLLLVSVSLRRMGENKVIFRA